MCQINAFVAAGIWGAELVIAGSGFGDPDPVTGSHGTVTLSGHGLLSIVPGSWTDDEIRVVLPSPGASADATYTISVAPLVGVPPAPCSRELEIKTPVTDFTIEQIGVQLRITVDRTTNADGTFGPPRGHVFLGDTELVAPGWQPGEIVASAAGIDPGTYQLRVQRLNGSTVTKTVELSAPTAPTGTLVLVTPNPTDWGARLTLRAIGLPFGPAPTDTTGVVRIQQGTTFDHPLAVSVWTPTEIVATLPKRTDPPGAYEIVVNTGRQPPPSGSLELRSGAGFSVGPILPILDWREVFTLKDRVVTQSGLLRAARDAATRWRYEYLKTEAIRAATQTQLFESHILQLMTMALSKVAAAEQLLNPVMIEAIRALQGSLTELADLAADLEIEKLISELADMAAKALLLSLLLLWLMQREALEFWLGLFERLIDDICSYDSDLGHVHKYLGEEFDRVIQLPLLKELLADLKGTIDTQVNAFASPLKQAVSEVLSGTNEAMKEILDAFDMPLLKKLGASTEVGLDDVNPLAPLGAKLVAMVENLIAKLRSQLLDAIDPLKTLRELFVDMLKTFVVIPIVAVLAIGFVMGGFGAAILAAILMLALHELVQLIASWLSGPLLGELEKLKQKVNDVIARLGEIFGRYAAVISGTSPEAILKMLASELRALRSLVPEAFLDELAEILSRARDVVMRGALQLAAAAEQALGLENATAFDAIGFTYKHVLTPSLLPGARDPSLFAGAALLRDLGKLEQHRSALVDGKELVVTHRLSVLDLLGGDRGRFLELLRSGRLQINLTEEVLLDRKFPGLYRALIQDISVHGLFDASVGTIPHATGIPIALTHLGTSWTRVKRNANPFAPPLDLPTCLGRMDTFLRQLRVLPTTRPGRFDVLPGPGAVERALADALHTWKTANPPPPKPDDYRGLDDRFPGRNGEQMLTIEHVWQAYVRYVPGTLRRRLETFCADADAEIFEAGVRALLEEAAKDVLQQARKDRDLLEEHINLLVKLYESMPLVPWAPVRPSRAALVDAYLSGSFLPSYSVIRPLVWLESDSSFSAARDDARNALIGDSGTGPIDTIVKTAFVAGIDRAAIRIAKWAGAKMVADRDPSVAAAGFVLLQRELAPETSVFHLYPDDRTATAPQTLIPLAGPNMGTPERAAATIQYRPFENHGLGGQLLLSLSALDPTGATGTTGDLLGLPGNLTPQIPPLTDLILDVTFRACYDETLAATVRANSRQGLSALAIANATVNEIAGLLPSSGRGRRTRTVRFSLRGHRDRTLAAWVLALSKGLNTGLPGDIPPLPDVTAVKPLLPDERFKPLTGTATDPTYQLRLLPDHSIAIPQSNGDRVKALTTLEHVLEVPLGDLGVPANDLNLDLKVTQIAVALIPFAAQGERVAANLELASITRDAFFSAMADPLQATTRPRRLLMFAQPSTEPELLAKNLPSDGAGITISLRDVTKLYDVLFSITYELPNDLVDATATGLI